MYVPPSYTRVMGSTCVLQMVATIVTIGFGAKGLLKIKFGGGGGVPN